MAAWHAPGSASWCSRLEMFAGLAEAPTAGSDSIGRTTRPTDDSSSAKAAFGSPVLPRQQCDTLLTFLESAGVRFLRHCVRATRHCAIVAQKVHHPNQVPDLAAPLSRKRLNRDK